MGLDCLADISFKSGNMVGSTTCEYFSDDLTLACMCLVPFLSIVGVLSGNFSY